MQHRSALCFKNHGNSRHHGSESPHVSLDEFQRAVRSCHEVSSCQSALQRVHVTEEEWERIVRPRVGVGRLGRTAKDALEAGYGGMLRQPPYSDLASPYLLHQALMAWPARIDVTFEEVKQWWAQYRRGFDGSAASAAALEEGYGMMLRRPPYSELNRPWALYARLAHREPPIDVSLAVVRDWVERYRDASGSGIRELGSVEGLVEHQARGTLNPHL